MTPPIDERRGRPSCSALHRLANCPASFWLSQGMPDTSGPDAESGNRIHEWLATHDGNAWLAMSPDEQDTAERCQKQATDVENAWLASIVATAGDVSHIVREERIGITKSGVTHFVRRDDGHDYDITGQADEIMVVKVGDKTHAAIIDFKSGRGEVEEARDNDQLRGLAVLVAHHFGCDTVRVAIVQPWAGPPSSAHYDAEALSHSLGWMDHVLDDVDAAEKNPAPVAGDWCKYCPARNRPCPALVANGTAPLAQTLLARPLPDGKEKEALFARAMEMTPNELGVLLDKLSMYDKAAEAVRWAARSVLDAGGEIPGWTLHTSKPRESITDVALVWTNLQRLGVAPETFTAACSMTKKALEPIVRAAANAKGVGLKIAMAGALAGAVTLGKPTIKLVRVGEQLEEGE